MPRSRNIKPAFFTNDELGDLPPLARLLFIGMWTLADYKGDLEWREKRIKAQLLPYDNCDIKKLAINLDKSGFVRFYSDGDKIYLNINNFSKHQNPHINEKKKGSDIPCYSEKLRQVVDLKGITINRDKSRQKPDENDTNPADSLNLIPDSLNLIPDVENEPAEQNNDFFGLPKRTIKEIREIRKRNKGGKISPRVAKSLSTEINLSINAGYTIDQILTEWDAAGWKSYKHDWLVNRLGRKLNEPNFSDDSTEWVNKDWGLI